MHFTLSFCVIVNTMSAMMKTETETQMARRTMKKHLIRLTNIEGNGTSLVTLCIASGSQISLTQKMLTTELGTATNIKSRVNRQSVITAIKSAQHKLKMYKETPKNGLALFCGMVIDMEGKEKMWSEVIEPPKPLTRGLYMCDNRFHTSLLEDMLQDAPMYGFIVIDGNGCLFATVQGDQKKIIGKFNVDLPKKHGRGGQSAQRFGRIRLEKRQAYVKKCCEMAVTHFITDEKCNVKGLIMAGSAEFKDVLASCDTLDPRLRTNIIARIDVPYGMEQGLHHALHQAGEQLDANELVEEQKLIAEYMNIIASDNGNVSFGFDETVRAMELGAADRVIVWEGLQTKMNEINIGVNTNDLFVDWLCDTGAREYGCTVKIVTDRTSHGNQFVKGFGGIGAILRWDIGDDNIENASDDEIVAY